ncbi:MAG: NAD(+) synthase [Bradymonadales bacterium]|nr:NAD(+) synthase [Bradymonadales bacterium]
MKLIKVGAAVLNQTPMDWDGNTSRILSAIDQARQRSVSVLCLPELCISGYGCEDAFFSPGLRTTAWQVLEEIVPHTAGMIVSLGLPVFHQNALFNAACLVADGRILGLVAKQFLAGSGLHYEPRWFTPWPAGRAAELVAGPSRYPLGDLTFDCGGIKIGFEICEDGWVAQRRGADLVSGGIDLILNPSASHFAFGKQEVRRRLVLEGSRAFCVTYLYSNLLGNEAGRVIYDGGPLIASAGRLVACGPRFSFQDHLLTEAVVDVDLTRNSQAQASGRSAAEQTARSRCVEADFHFPSVAPQPVKNHLASWEQGPFLKEEEFTRAIALGLFDYLRKSQSNGFVVSLSGGADSSATACLVALMAQLASDELGLDGLKKKLAYIDGLKPQQTTHQVVHQLLTCAYQSTQNSSSTTLNAARQVAEAIGARFLLLDVDGLVTDYIRLIAGAIGRELTWEQDDVALQNIQARARAPGVWLLANLWGALLLTTSNRSEAAVGYATMDGDTCGGLAPIGGIDKDYLRRWLRWLETDGPSGLGPIPALAAVNQQAPTAELRPPSRQQTDEGDLMPYDLLNSIEQAFIRDRMSPTEVLQLMAVHYPQYGREQLALWVARFFSLWCRNQWKRERYAPSFHVDDESLDPKTWCRFPILSGGFRREIDQMKTSSPGDR